MYLLCVPPFEQSFLIWHFTNLNFVVILPFFGKRMTHCDAPQETRPIGMKLEISILTVSDRKNYKKFIKFLKYFPEIAEYDFN